MTSMMHLVQSLRCRNDGQLVNILFIAAARQVRDWRIQPLQNRANGFKITEALGDLVADVPSLQVWEDEDIGIASHC